MGKKQFKQTTIINSNFISPALLIKLSEQLENKNKNEENIDEEIIPKDRQIDSLFEGRRKQLQMTKFAGWAFDLELVMGNSVDKDTDCLLTILYIFQNNYIMPQSVYVELEKKSHQQNNACRKKIEMLLLLLTVKVLQYGATQCYTLLYSVIYLLQVIQSDTD